MSDSRSYGQLPETGFIRTSQLLELLSISPVTLWRWRRDGAITAPHKVGRMVLWPVEEVRKFIAAGSLQDQ